jgi:phosphopantothenate-cysteine ligase
VEGTRELERTLRKILPAAKPDAVIHSMAVSDYRVARITSRARIAQAVADITKKTGPLEAADIEAALSKARAFDPKTKISSEVEGLTLFMERTPKIIGLIKDILPQTLLVGFKLLNKVSEEELINVAYGLLVKNHCAFVLANDSQYFNGDSHRGFLIDSEKKAIRYETKQDIAQGLVGRVLEALNAN